MVVALVKLRWSVFVSKSYHKFVVSTSFWSWLLNVSSVFTSLKYTATLFGLLMRCGSADGPWKFWVLILVFIFLKYVFSLCSSLMGFFVVQFLFRFSGQCVAS